MKRAVLAFLLFCFIKTEAQEQVFALKPAAGLSGCQVHGDSYSGFDKLGFFAGLAVNAQTGKRSSLEMGFYYSQKGARHNQNPKAGDYTFYRLQLHYIDMPLLFRYHVNKDYFVTLGPSVAYLMGYSEENHWGDWSGVYPFEKFEVSVNVGLGRRLSDKWSVEVRSTNSITPIRAYGVLANQVFYPNPVARFFNKGMYNNLLTVMVARKLSGKERNEPVK
jgi:hypothetical protein